MKNFKIEWIFVAYVNKILTNNQRALAFALVEMTFGK